MICSIESIDCSRAVFEELEFLPRKNAKTSATLTNTTRRVYTVLNSSISM